MQQWKCLVVALGTVAALAACGSNSSSVSSGNGGQNGGSGGGSGAGTAGPKTRYAMNNQCWAIRNASSGQYLQLQGGSYGMTAASLADAEPVFLKPTALGKYMLYTSERDVLTASGSSVSTTTSAAANDSAEWTVTGVGDTTTYPPTPEYHVEPTPEQVNLWHGFVDPELKFENFTLFSADSNRNLSINGEGDLVTVSPETVTAAEGFSFVPTQGCAEFPEASSDFTGTPFSGKTADGRVLGHADVHVHISATEFLGGAEWGRPYHKFGVEHALGDCDDPLAHGPMGALDLLGTAFGGDTDGHATDGYPEFTEWPQRDSLTHEAIYWKWLERTWAGGLRVVVNDLVDNTTLCELERNARGTQATQDCNSMNNSGRQAGTMYGMENYIDAQYGGPGKGFFQIVHDSTEARAVIEDGKMAVVLGIEISNLFDCQLTYNPLRTQEPFEEDGSGLPTENAYNCTMEEGLPNSVLTQIERIHGWGVRQVITIHEFDNAFGGNGIFDGMILNLGNRENSGGIPSGDLQVLFNGDVPVFLSNLETAETPTGEFWTTYDCPIEGETPGFSGYLWGNSGGAVQQYSQFPLCAPMGQGGRAGGITPCYPTTAQCNARWMTPIGLYTYGKLMEHGFIFDFDHLEVGMKTQLIELAEAQQIGYPLVSTHGTFGGTTIDQAKRVLKLGGFLYPSNGSSRGFVADMDETLQVFNEAFADVPAAARPLFGFGYGTDTNGLSAQSRPRSSAELENGQPLTYPFTFYAGSEFDELADFDTVNGLSFGQPTSRAADGTVVRTWNADEDGTAHQGMVVDFIQEIRLDSGAQHLTPLFNSAEVFLRTWSKTEQSSAAIRAEGLNVPSGVLRPAPVGKPAESPYP